jgi:hypothetical protein
MFNFFCATDATHFRSCQRRAYVRIVAAFICRCERGNESSVIAASARWRELLAAMQFEPADLHELEEVD